MTDKLPPSWSTFAGDLRHKQGDLTLIQALKAIRIEDQHRQNSKIKSEMKAKVNFVEDKPKRNFMNPKGKMFKKPNHFSFFSPCKLYFFQTFLIFLLQTQNLWPEDWWKILLRLRENQSLDVSMFQSKKGTS